MVACVLALLLSHLLLVVVVLVVAAVVVAGKATADGAEQPAKLSNYFEGKFEEIHRSFHNAFYVRTSCGVNLRRMQWDCGGPEGIGSMLRYLQPDIILSMASGRQFNLHPVHWFDHIYSKLLADSKEYSHFYSRHLKFWNVDPSPPFLTASKYGSGKLCEFTGLSWKDEGDLARDVCAMWQENLGGGDDNSNNEDDNDDAGRRTGGGGGHHAGSKGGDGKNRHKHNNNNNTRPKMGSSGSSSSSSSSVMFPYELKAEQIARLKRKWKERLNHIVHHHDNNSNNNNSNSNSNNGGSGGKKQNNSRDNHKGKEGGGGGGGGESDAAAGLQALENLFDRERCTTLKHHYKDKNDFGYPPSLPDCVFPFVQDRFLRFSSRMPLSSSEEALARRILVDLPRAGIRTVGIHVRFADLRRNRPLQERLRRGEFVDPWTEGWPRLNQSLPLLDLTRTLHHLAVGIPGLRHQLFLFMEGASQYAEEAQKKLFSLLQSNSSIVVVDSGRDMFDLALFGMMDVKIQSCSSFNYFADLLRTDAVIIKKKDEYGRCSDHTRYLFRPLALVVHFDEIEKLSLRDLPG